VTTSGRVLLIYNGTAQTFMDGVTYYGLEGQIVDALDEIPFGGTAGGVKFTLQPSASGYYGHSFSATRSFPVTGSATYRYYFYARNVYGTSYTTYMESGNFEAIFIPDN